MTSSPISTRMPPMTSGSTTTLRCTGRPYWPLRARCEAVALGVGEVARHPDRGDALSVRLGGDLLVLARARPSRVRWVPSTRLLGQRARWPASALPSSRSSSSAALVRDRRGPGRRARSRRSGCSSISSPTANSSSASRPPSSPADSHHRDDTEVLQGVGQVARPRSSDARTASATRSRPRRTTLPSKMLRGPGRPSPSAVDETSVAHPAQARLGAQHARRRRTGPRRPVGASLATPSTGRPGRPARRRAARSSAWHQLAPMRFEPASLASSCASRSARKRSTTRAGALVVLQALADDATGQRRGQRADLGTQRGDRLLALRLDLGLAVLDDARRLGLSLLTHLGDDLGTLLTRLLTDARRLVTGLGELLLELGELGVGLGLLGLGRLEATLDGGRALGERLLEVRARRTS